MRFFQKKKKAPITDIPQGQARQIWDSFRKNKLAMAALIVLVIIVASAICCGFVFDYEIDALQMDASNRLSGPSLSHWFGTDNFGRDLFVRVLFGTRYSLLFGIGCTALSLLIGCLFGAVAAYYGGIMDSVIMRIVDAVMCIPSILLALTIVAVAGAGIRSLIIAITISNIPGFTRMVRSVILSVVSQDYIEAARSCGTRDRTIILRHLLPNALGPILVNSMMQIAGMIMTAAGLSYIGMGVSSPTPEWGSMLSEGVEMMRLYPHLVIFPGMAILVTALSFNLIGDGLTDALDPHRRTQ
ncbi:MAG: ABC transporter permease [Clostridiales bacterium]|nr:ABC transporter permease [Clostridiales bacterium]